MILALILALQYPCNPQYTIKVGGDSIKFTPIIQHTRKPIEFNWGFKSDSTPKGYPINSTSIWLSYNDSTKKAYIHPYRPGIALVIAQNLEKKIQRTWCVKTIK